MRTTAREDGIDGGHSAPQFIGCAQLIDCRAKYCAGGVSRTRNRQHQDGKPKNVGAGEQNRSNAIDTDTDKNPPATLAHGAEQTHGPSRKKRADSPRRIEDSESFWSHEQNIPCVDWK